MTLKIERLSDKRRTRIRLSGEFWSEHLDQVKAEIERGGPRVDLGFAGVGFRGCRRCSLSQRARGGGCLSAAPLALYQGMDAPGTRVGQGKAGLRKKMESRYGEVASPLQVLTSINEASLLAAAKSGKNSGARHAVHVTQFLNYRGRKALTLYS